jgi:hypothetical protein
MMLTHRSPFYFALVLGFVVFAAALRPAQAQAPGPYYPPPSAPVPTATAQPTERTANNTLYAELGGAGFVYSVDYDHTFGNVAARIGFSYLSISGSDGMGNSASVYFLAIPISLSYIGIRSGSHIFEVGGGATIVQVGAGANSFGVSNDSATASATAVVAHGIVGYRYQPLDGGFFFRGGFAPLIGKSTFFPIPYLSFGASF